MVPEGFPFHQFNYKYNGIPFAAHIVRYSSHCAASFNSRNSDLFYFYWEGLNTALDLWYVFIERCFVLGHTKKMLIVEISLLSKYYIFLQWNLRDITYCTFNTIYWQNIISKTKVCICFTEITQKLYFGIKHIAQKDDVTYGGKWIYILLNTFLFKFDIFLKIAMPVLLFW